MDESTEVRTDGNSLLKAVCLSRLRLTRLLLEGGAYINESNEHGETPLMVACRTRHMDSQSVSKHKMVRYLLKNGADPNIQDKTGKTALIHACLEQAGAEILSLLLSHGADPTLEDHAGLSALVHAVNSGNREVLRVLLDACKLKGKEVIIITTNKLPSGRQVTKQYLNVPPADLEERLHHVPTSGLTPASDIQPQTSPQGSSAFPQLHSPPLGYKDPSVLGHSPSPPDSQNQLSSPSHVPGADKRVHLHRLQSEQWTRCPSLLLQLSQTSSLSSEPVDFLTPEEEWSARVGGPQGFYRRPPVISRHHSIDVKDATGLRRALENMSGHEDKGGGGRRGGLGRKMSYDSVTGSPHSASNPNLHHDSLPFPLESIHVHKDSSDCLRPQNVSTLQNVVCRRNIGINHYSSDSQLPQFGYRDNGSTGASGAERPRQVSGCSSTLSGSRESLESSVQRRDAARPEQRGPGAHLLGRITHTRPGHLPPLNPHAPIPDIGVGSNQSYALSGSSKMLNGVFTGSKPVLPSAPVFPRNLKANNMLWRRHSMQSEQIKQLANFEETFSH